MYPYDNYDDRQFGSPPGQFGPPAGQFTSPFGQFAPPFGQFGPPFEQPGAQPGPFVPGGVPGTPPPFGGVSGGSAPSGPPPAFTPAKPAGAPGVSIFAVDPGAIRPCTFRFVYIWLINGRSFWAFIVFVGPNSIAGWRWTGSRWVYFGTDLRNINTFVCY